jgi:membrane protein
VLQLVREVRQMNRETMVRHGKALYAKFKENNTTTLAAAFSYHTVFSIPALLILTISIAAVLERATSINISGPLRDLIRDRAPEDTKELLNSIVDKAVAKVGAGGASFGLIVTALLALWSGSNAVSTLISSFNLAYGVEETRKTVRLRGTTLGLTLGLALFVNLALALLVFGHKIGSWLADKAGFGSAFNWTWGLLRWPVGVVAIALILSTLYSIGPNVERPFRWWSPGSILATLLWLLLAGGFGIYLRFANPGSAYGALGSVLVLMFFLYVTGIIFLVGAQLNAVLESSPQPEVETDIERRSGVSQRAD